MATVKVKRSLEEGLVGSNKQKQLKVSEPPKESTSSSTSSINNPLPPKPLTEDELKLRKIIEKRREQRRKVNQIYYKSTGHCATIRQFDKAKRIQSEQEELDENLDKMLDTVRDLQAKFTKRLEKRDKDIAANRLDPEEPTSKEHARQMTQWLSIVPTLLATYENKKRGEWKLDTNNRDLYQLTTVFNYVDQGNNQGAPGAVPPPPRELPDFVDSDSESESEDENDFSDVEFEDDDDVIVISDSDDSDDEGHESDSTVDE